jgi:predicted Rossmann fold nucleotide-binding protein DprA/Smf involved in DNA uptake
MKVELEKIVSGGQTGTDRAALDVAMKYGIETGGWCPAGRKAEDGVIPESYQLTETKARNYATRTKRNVRDSDGTLVLNLGEFDGGSLQTVEYAEKRGKPCLVVQLDNAGHLGSLEVTNWLMEHGIRVLNVAGPRESKRPGIYRQSFEFLEHFVMIINA